MENDYKPNFETSTRTSHKTALGVAVFLFLLVGNFYLYSRLKRAEVEAHTLEATLKAELARLEKKSSFHLNNAQIEIEQLRETLEKTREEAAKRAKSEARRYTNRLSRDIASQERTKQEAVMGEIRTLHNKTSATEGRVSQVHTELTGVKSTVEETQSQLDATDSAVKNTKERMQAMSEWISANSSEIGELRERTDRHYFRFSLSKSDKMQKIGDVLLRLRKTEPKRHRYTLEILADDKKFVKKKQYVNEPVEFYVHGSNLPYEIVMTSIKKDQVVGFLAKPKIQMASR